MEELVLSEQLGDRPVTIITINRPRALNALNTKVWQELMGAFIAVPVNTRAIILRGAPAETSKGEYPSCCAGADIDTLVQADGSALPFDEAKAHMEEGLDAIQELIRLKKGKDSGRTCPIVVIGAVAGPLLGGGLELFINVCDIIIAAEGSTFGLPEYDLGGLGGWRGPQRLAELLGGNQQRLKYLLLGNKIGAQTAAEWGIVTQTEKINSFPDKAVEVAIKVAQGDPLATKYNLALAEMPPWEDRTALATMKMSHLMVQPAWVEKVGNFLDKRKK